MKYNFATVTMVNQSLPDRLAGMHSVLTYLALTDFPSSAITRGREVGIDLERIRSDMTYESIAERFFSPRENAMLHSLPNNIKPTAFFNCWTRKEAYIKARGVGLSIPLDQFDVSLIPGEPASLSYQR